MFYFKAALIAAWPGVAMEKVKDAALGHQPIYAVTLEVDALDPIRNNEMM